MENLFLYILQITLAGSITLSGTLLFHPLTQKYFNARWHYSLLKALALFFIIPISKIVMMCFPLLRIEPFSVLPTMMLKQAPTETGDNFLPVLGNSMHGFNWLLALAAVWIVGMGAQCFWHSFCLFRFKNETQKSVKITDETLLVALKKAKNKLEISQSIDVFLNNSISSPVFTGFFTPKILLPNKIFSEKTAEHIFTHELIHFKRKDLWIKAVLLIIQTIHWFNPFVYVLKKTIENQLEYSCDECVANGLTHTERKEYGMALLEAIASKEHPKHVYMGLAFGTNKTKIERRLTNMLNFKAMKESKKVFATVIAVALMAVSAVPVFAAENAVTEVPSNTAYSQSKNVVASSVQVSEDLNAANYVGGSAKIDQPSPYASGDLAAGKSYSYDKQSLTKGQTVTINAEWTPTGSNIQIGLKSASGTVTAKTVSNGSGDVTYTINSTGDYSIYIGNPSSANVKFDVSYIVN